VALALNATLGEPAARETAADAREVFPAETVALLEHFGLSTYYVPARWGGRLDEFDVLFELWRTVARHDLTALVAHGKTFLGAASVWVAGSAEQAQAAAVAVLAGEPMAWALSEPGHGADLLGGECAARESARGWLLDGVKWPINNATRANRLTVLARTDEAGGARGHSLFLVDKTKLGPGTWRCLPKEPTHGIRGADISGIEFCAAEVPAEAMIGSRGSGVETVLRALQLTRTLCAALSVGAGERALRLAAAFTAGRLIKGKALADRAHPAAVLARSAALLAAAESASLVAARSLNALTRESSVTSAVAKALAPTLVDAVLGELAELLGARSFLCDVYEHGAFQKLWRDHQVVAIFDGSSPVNRAALVQQFPMLVRGFAAGTHDAAGLPEAVDPSLRSRPLRPELLTPVSRHGSSVVQALPAAAERLPAGPVADQARALCADLARLSGLMAQVRPAARPQISAYELAEAYELCYAGAACVLLWEAEAARHSHEPLWADGLWPRATLRALRVRIAATLRWAPPEPTPGDAEVEFELARHTAQAAVNGDAISPFGMATAAAVEPLVQAVAS
jgi:alkylation response protein AidB-like acyl-CoA dehydrogenase